MNEARCGTLCSRCEYREKMNCPGCAYLAGDPFWGPCDIKNCCEGKGHTHCGQCGNFPCQKLIDYAYMEEHGDQGRRLWQCLARNREQEANP